MVTVSPKGDGIALLYTSIFLLALGWITFLTRAAVRLSRKIFGLDDQLMAVGLLLFTVTASLCIVCSFYGSGQLAVTLPASTKMRGIKLFFIAEFFYAAGAAIIKCSIAVTLLRIADSRRRYTYTIYTIMMATSLSAVIFIIGIANICHPITTLWGETTTGSCNLKLNSDVSFFFSAIEIATDWSLAILPAVLLWNIQMKGKVKVSVAGILGLAAFASCATIVRLRYLSLYSDAGEFMYSTGKVGLWSIIEEGIGIFAGSIPALRPLLSRSFFFGGANNSSDRNATPGPNSASNFKVSGSRHKIMGRNDINMDTFVELGDDGQCDADANSQKHILKETSVRMMSNERSTPPGEWEKSQVLGWKDSNYKV